MKRILTFLLTAAFCLALCGCKPLFPVGQESREADSEGSDSREEAVTSEGTLSDAEAERLLASIRMPDALVSFSGVIGGDPTEDGYYGTPEHALYLDYLYSLMAADLTDEEANDCTRTFLFDTETPWESGLYLFDWSDWEEDSEPDQESIGSFELDFLKDCIPADAEKNELGEMLMYMYDGSLREAQALASAAGAHGFDVNVTQYELAGMYYYQGMSLAGGSIQIMYTADTITVSIISFE